MKLKIEYVKPGDLVPYSGNAKLHPAEQIEQIKKSIEEFGFNDPIAIWQGNEIIEGHGRLIAALEMGLDKVPVVRLDGLTDEQRRAYTLVHNKLTMNSDFDVDLLSLEIGDIDDIDMEQFGFELPDFDDPDVDVGYYGDERERTYNSTNFNEYDESRVEGAFEMPKIEPVDYIPQTLLGFNYAKTAKDYNACIHFYLDDYQFERVWNDPHKYLRMLTHFEASMTPNFSIYRDMPEALKIWNTYRARLLGQMMQDHGILVVPIVYWSDERSFSYCFDGLPENGTLSVNYIANKSDESKELWKNGMAELLKRKTPKRILLYGNGAVPDFDFGGTEVISYKNSVTERMRGNV